LGVLSRAAEMPLRRALSDHVFAAYTFGHSISQLGSWTQQLALGWLAWTLTQSESWLGIIAFCQFAPALLLAPFAGAVADRFDRLTVAMVGQTLAACQALALYILTAFGWMTIEILAVCVAFSGSVSTFSLPSLRALASGLVPHDLIPTAISVNSITSSIARFTGPMLAGLLIHAGYIEACFLFNAISFGAFIASLAFVRSRRVRPVAEPGGSHRPAFLSTVREGLSYAMAHPAIRAVFIIYLAYALLGRPAVDLLPAIVGRLLGGGSETLALLTSAFGLAAIVTGLLLTLCSTYRALWGLLAAGTITLSIGMIGLTSVSSVVLAVAAMVVYGIGQVIINVTSQTLSQWLAVDELRGRVMALHFMLFRSGAALGGLALGALGDLIGLRIVFIAAGTLLLIVAAATVLRGIPPSPFIARQDT
jgi:MFS family permease